MGYITVKFLDEKYTFPKDILTYIDLLKMTEEVKSQLLKAFNGKLKPDIGYITDNDIEWDIQRQVKKFISKLCDQDIFTRTVNDYLKNNKGYQFFLQANKEAFENAKLLLSQEMDAYQAGVEKALYKKESSITGMGFSIWSSSFLNHAIYAAMQASTINKQERAAERQYQSDIKALDEMLSYQYGDVQFKYIRDVYVPNVEIALTFFSYELLDRYISDLIDHQKFSGEVLKYIDIERSNDLLNNLKISTNKVAVLKNAFVICPYNYAVYDEAINFDLLDHSSFQTAQKFGQSEMVLDKLRVKLGSVSYPQKFKIDYNVANTIATFTEKSSLDVLKSHTYLYASKVVDAYCELSEISSDIELCHKVMSEYSASEILSDVDISKYAAYALVNKIVNPSVWEQLTNKCGHTDLLEKIKSQIPQARDITDKADLDNYFVDKLMSSFENARKILASEIETKRKELEHARIEAEQKAKEEEIAKNKFKKITIMLSATIATLVIICTIVNTMINVKAYKSMAAPYFAYEITDNDGDIVRDDGWWFTIKEDGSVELCQYADYYGGFKMEVHWGKLANRTSYTSIDEFNIMDFNAQIDVYEKAKYCYKLKLEDGHEGYVIYWVEDGKKKVDVYYNDDYGAYNEYRFSCVAYKMGY